MKIYQPKQGLGRGAIGTGRGGSGLSSTQDGVSAFSDEHDLFNTSGGRRPKAFQEPPSFAKREEVRLTLARRAASRTFRLLWRVAVSLLAPIYLLFWRLPKQIGSFYLSLINKFLLSCTARLERGYNSSKKAAQRLSTNCIERVTKPFSGLVSAGKRLFFALRKSFDQLTTNSIVRAVERARKVGQRMKELLVIRPQKALRSASRQVNLWGSQVRTAPTRWMASLKTAAQSKWSQISTGFSNTLTRAKSKLLSPLRVIVTAWRRCQQAPSLLRRALGKRIALPRPLRQLWKWLIGRSTVQWKKANEWQSRSAKLLAEQSLYYQEMKERVTVRLVRAKEAAAQLNKAAAQLNKKVVKQLTPTIESSPQLQKLLAKGKTLFHSAEEGFTAAQRQMRTSYSDLLAALGKRMTPLQVRTKTIAEGIASLFNRGRSCFLSQKNKLATMHGELILWSSEWYNAGVVATRRSIRGALFEIGIALLWSELLLREIYRELLVRGDAIFDTEQSPERK